MMPDEKPRFVVLLTETAELYNKAFSSASLDIYWRILKRYSFKVFEDAINRHLTEKDRGRFMPLPADIVFQIESVVNSTIAWTKACEAVRIIGSYNSLVLDDALLHCVIVDLGGWIAFCSISEKQLPFTQREFESRYQHYLRYPPKEYPRILTGRIDHQNLSMGYPRQPPIFMGNHDLSLQVYQGGVEHSSLHRLRIGILQIEKALSKATFIGHDKPTSSFNYNQFITERDPVK